MSTYQKDILDDISSNIGLYEKIFGKLLDDLVYNSEMENQKNILVNVFGYKDIGYIFKKQIERTEFSKLSKTVFRINNNNDE